MTRFDRTFMRALVSAMLAGTGLAGWSVAGAQTAATDASASMVQPPASGVNAHNPDNMPVKRPAKPTNDPIARRPPASAAHAK